MEGGQNNLSIEAKEGVTLPSPLPTSPWRRPRESAREMNSEEGRCHLHAAGRRDGGTEGGKEGAEEKLGQGSMNGDGKNDREKNKRERKVKRKR
ncbi:hypothetical protein E2C01_102455 [Portunus trituberculatus]|uniref:Uncharacterized protein n=1 Tax=Portunus trituberculatus TaxID=210409 RepID=A0A5B7KCN1_PORTR|nr:hypothetical protein [Portunus trituberculatus]